MPSLKDLYLKRTERRKDSSQRVYSDWFSWSAYSPGDGVTKSEISTSCSMVSFCLNLPILLKVGLVYSIKVAMLDGGCEGPELSLAFMKVELFGSSIVWNWAIWKGLVEL